MGRRRMGIGTCAYCREGSDTLEEEHVFPESWYPSTTPTGVALITVPSCPRCNRDYGRLEERLQRQWAVCIDTTNPAALGIWDRVSRSLDPERGRNERDARARRGNREKLRASIRSVPVGARGAFPGLGAVAASWSLQPSGLLALSSNAVMLSAEDVSALTAKLVRGLHFRVHGAPVAPDVAIKTYVVTQDTWPELLQRVRTMTPQGIPPGFLFWRAVAKDNPRFAIWYFLVWGQVFLQAATVPSEVLDMHRVRVPSVPG